MGIISIKFFVFAAAAILIYYLFPVKNINGQSCLPQAILIIFSTVTSMFFICL